MFLANERSDIQYCVKECARGVQNPSARDMQRAKSICRYLMGTRDWTMCLDPWKDVDTPKMFVDSAWATERLLELHSLAAVRSSVSFEPRDHQRCRRLRPKDMPSEAVHARDFSSVLLRKS